MALSVLVVSSDGEARWDLVQTLEAQGCESISAASIKQAMELLTSGAGQFIGDSMAETSGRPVNLVFCDRDLSDGTYQDFLTAVRALKNRTRVVIMSRLADWDEYLDAMHLGAFDVIAAPCRPADVEWTLIQARRELRESTLIDFPSELQRRATAS